MLGGIVDGVNLIEGEQAFLAAAACWSANSASWRTREAGARTRRNWIRS